MSKDPFNPDLVPGDVYHGFQLESVTKIPNLGAHLYQLTDQRTRAKMIHMSLEDDNNLFSVAFPTSPTDSTGVAHILEHTALCGSKNYDVRDPFFSMIKRSLKNFMNAFTASDWTMYPFSTQNEKDFYNLMNVYLDAAFFPNLTELNFLQEGHRIEFEEPENPESPLVFKGVVYNEMKGAMSTQSSIMYRRLTEALFPTVTYHHNSGGEPADIVNLTHQQLKDFHKSHYHPSNGYFFTYGDLPLKGHLERIQEKVLQNFEAIEVHTAVPAETRYTEPKDFEFYYPLNESEDDGAKNQLLLSWLCCDVKDQVEVMSLQILNVLLFGSAAAPLRKALMESKLGTALADGTGYEEETRETFFSVGMQGVKEEDFEKLEDLIFDTLIDVIAKGIPAERIEAAIHQMELDVREISGGSYPYSINLLFRFFGPWIHGGDPIEAIDFDGTLAKLKERLQTPRYFENKIKEYLMENHHRVRLILKPDHRMQERQEEETKTRLEEIQKGLSEEEKKRILDQAQALKELQETEEDLSQLPTLELEDIPKEVKFLDPDLEGIGSRDFTFYERKCNGIFYFSMVFPVPELTEEEQLWLPLLGSFLTGTGTGDWSYDRMAEEVARYTGGFAASPGLERRVGTPESFNDFSIGTKALERNIPKMFELLKRYLTDWHFKEADRIQSLVKQRATHLKNAINGSGHMFAANWAMRGFSESLKVSELYGGISQVKFLKELAELETDELMERLEPMKAVLKKILTSKNLALLAVGSSEALAQAREEALGLFDLLEEGELPPARLKVESPSFAHEAWLTSTPVSYVAKCLPVPSFGHEDAPKLMVLANLLKAEFLHGEIREKGGAYGGFSAYNSQDGVFMMLSYRDPNLGKTLDVYERALDWIRSGKFDEENLKEAILQCASSLDVPHSPAKKASNEYLFRRQGRSPELRQQHRESLLATTKEEVIAVAEKWLSGDYATTAVTSAEILNKDSAKERLAGREI